MKSPKNNYTSKYHFPNCPPLARLPSSNQPPTVANHIPSNQQTPNPHSRRHIRRRRELPLPSPRKAPLPPLPLLRPHLLHQILQLIPHQRIRPPRSLRRSLRPIRRMALLLRPTLPGRGARHRSPPRPLLPRVQTPNYRVRNRYRGCSARLLS